MEPDVATPPTCTYRFGTFSYDSRNRKLSRAGQAVRTTPKALHVLEVLLRAQGNLVSIDDLTSAVWPGVYVDRTTIHQNVATLRRLLEDDPKAPAFIETVPRLGYRFLYPVTIEQAPEPAAAPRRRLPRLGGVAFAGVVLIAAVLFETVGRPGSVERPSPAQAQYELGRQYWNERLSQPQADAARQAFRNAIRLDPRFALAHVGLADSYLFESEKTGIVEDEIRAALALNPNLGEAYASLGFLRMFHRQDWSGAEEAFQRSLQLSPQYATAHHWHGTLLLVRARLNEARAELERAASLDLLSVPIAADLAALAYYEGNQPEAAAGMRRVLVRAPAFVFAQRYLMKSLMLSGNFEDAIAAIEEFPAMYSPLRFETASLPRRPTEKLWTELCRSPNPYEQAVCWGVAGHTDRALDQLESAVRGRHPLMMYAGVEPAFLKLRGNQRFRAALRGWKLGDLPAAQ
jgi:DNA-binding winged helix-turn-helix (wHTH) protein/Tfp pilus assembly protein PilF